MSNFSSNRIFFQFIHGIGGVLGGRDHHPLHEHMNMTLSLSLHHLINFCRAAWAASFIFTHAECESKLQPGRAIICFLSKVRTGKLNIHWSLCYHTD